MNKFQCKLFKVGLMSTSISLKFTSYLTQNVHLAQLRTPPHPHGLLLYPIVFHGPGGDETKKSNISKLTTRPRPRKSGT